MNRPVLSAANDLSPDFSCIIRAQICKFTVEYVKSAIFESMHYHISETSQCNGCLLWTFMT